MVVYIGLGCANDIGNGSVQVLSPKEYISNNNKILIRKASGESELFDASKLKHSLLRAGADKKTSESIAFDIGTSLNFSVRGYFYKEDVWHGFSDA